jgi:hypothetical protein
VELFELAYLLRQPIQYISQMSHEEYSGWLSYFKKRPVEWRADNRAATQIISKGIKLKPQQIFPSLVAIYEAEDSYDKFKLKGSKMFANIMSSVGGEKLNF